MLSLYWFLRYLPDDQSFLVDRKTNSGARLSDFERLGALVHPGLDETRTEFSSLLTVLKILKN
jgi:hypothetical protein